MSAHAAEYDTHAEQLAAATLPAKNPVVLPEPRWLPTKAQGSRNGHRIRLVVAHRWGVRYTTPAAEALSYQGVLREFKNPANDASAHWVYPGSAVAHGHEATQMVARANKAWTEAGYNPDSMEIESADAIWLGDDWYGFHVLARMMAYELQHAGLPPVWVHGEALLHNRAGFCRHADLGQLGGGHTSCPTTDLKLWALFAAAVEHEYARGDWRATPWGR